MQRIILAALAFALAFCGGAAIGQVNPGFNPNTQWGSTWGMIPYRGSTTWQGLPPGTAGQVLVSGGTGANPYWNTITGTGTVTSVSGSGGTTGLTLTGGPITGAGTLTLGGTLAPANGGTGAAGAANTAFTSNGTVGSWTQITSAMIASNTITNGNIGASAGITPSKFATQPTMTVLANITGGAAVPTTPTVTTLLDNAFGSSQGMMLYRGAAGWQALAVGNSGEFLRTNGAASDPVWQAVSGALGGTVTNVASGAGLTGGPITATGTLSINAGAIPGVANNSTATAGNVGEEISAVLQVGSAASLSNGSATQFASIGITAGDWDVTGQAHTFQSAGTSVTNISCSIETTANTVTTTVPRAAGMGIPYTASGGSATTLTIPPFRVSLSGTTTYYIGCVQAASANGGMYGSIRARRIR